MNALHSTALRRFAISFAIVVLSATVVGGSAFLADLQRCGATPPATAVIGATAVFGCSVDTNAIGLVLLTALVSGFVRALLGAVTDLHSFALSPTTVATTPVNAVGSAVGPTTLAVEAPVATPSPAAAVAPVPVAPVAVVPEPAPVVPADPAIVSAAPPVPPVTPSIILENHT